MMRNRRRYGGYLVHLGIIVIAVGIALSSTYRAEREATLGVGDRVTFAGYTVGLDSLYAGREPHRDFVEASFSIWEGNDRVAVMRPRLNYYPTSDQPIGSPHVRTRPTEDLYLSLMAYARDGSNATVSIIVNPMVVWIWIGGGIAALGALFAISTIGFAARRPAAPGGRRTETSQEPAKAAVGGAD